MSELHPDDRKQLARVLGMKPAEIVAAVELPDTDPPSAVVETHDGQCVLVTSDGDGKPFVAPWEGRMPGAPVPASERVLIGESGPDLIVAPEDGAEVTDPNAQTDSHGGTDDQVPAGTVDEVLAWVSDDTDRAARALVVEQDSDKPRKGLVDQLKKLAGQA